MALHLQQRAPAGATTNRSRCKAHPPSSRQSIVRAASSAAEQDVKPSNGLQRGLMTDITSWVINTPALYTPLKEMARLSIKKGAVKRGTDWDGTVQRYQARLPELEALKQQMTDPSLAYPDYYTQPFHAYAEGNLNWLAAFEGEPANTAIAMRAFKTETHLTPQQAMDKLYGCITDAYDAYRRDYGLKAPEQILDMGCSVGVSSRWLAQSYPQAQVLGADLSPYFLAVAEDKERQLEASGLGGRRRIRYQHLRAEHTGLPDASVDLVSFLFVMHELPAAVTRAIVQEAKRVLKPGGVIIMVDTNPHSEVIQKLPAPIYMMMKSTEPHMDEFAALDMPQVLQQAGFQNAEKRNSDHRHQAIIGTA